MSRRSGGRESAESHQEADEGIILSGLIAELLGFPNTKHDDQVDSVSQALSWIKQHRQNQIAFATPIVIYRPRESFDIPFNF